MDTISYRDRLTWSVPETLLQLGIGRTTLYSLISEGRLEAIKIGRRRLIVASSAQALIERLQTEAA